MVSQNSTILTYLTVPQRIHAIKTLEYPLRTQVTGQIAKITAEILATTTYRGWSVFSLSGRGRGLTCMNRNTTPVKSMQDCIFHFLPVNSNRWIISIVVYTRLNIEGKMDPI